MDISDITKTLESIAREIKPTSAKLDLVGEIATESIRSHIYEGKSFAPLSPATAAYRGTGRPLQDTGSLRDSITYEKTQDGVKVGTNKLYAATHNSGGRITAKKQFLFIPAQGTRQLQRKYGYKPAEVLNGLRSAGYKVFRKGRTICFYKKGIETKVAYYLKKTVVIPKREFFYLTDTEVDQIVKEVFNDKL